MAAPQTTHELSLPLPHALSTTIHLHLTIASKHLLLFLTTRSPDTPSGPAPLGSFVYALPSDTGKPLSTPLYVREQTLETATRIAQILAARTKRPVYVGCSMSFSSAGMGGAVEEEMEGVRKVVEVVVGLVNGEALKASGTQKEKGDGEGKGTLKDGVEGLQITDR